ncbi:MAG: DUF4412 domain-containing protein [Gemmatimonadaceae bacterium]
MIPAIRAAGLAFAALAPLAPLAVRPAAAQQPFEGVITVRTTGMQAQQQDAQYYVRQGASRVEMTSSRGQMVLVTDPQKRTMYMMMPEQKTYMERPLAPAPGPVTKDAPAESQVVRTGRTDTIAGFQCEHVTITTERGAADACVTRQLGAVPAMGAGMRRGMGGPGGGAGAGAGARGGAMGGWRAALDAQPDLGFPLRVETDGRTVWEVTKVERRTLDPALFAVPAGYQQMQMPMGSPGGQPPQSRPPVE